MHAIALPCPTYAPDPHNIVRFIYQQLEILPQNR